MSKKLLVLAAVLGVGLLASSNVMAGDAIAGEKYFNKKCKSCHGKLVAGGKHATGPNLWGVTTRQAGTAEGYTRYSDPLKESDIMWTDENLDKWLTKPRKFIAKSKMGASVKKEEDRANLIAYLKTAK